MHIHLLDLILRCDGEMLSYFLHSMIKQIIFLMKNLAALDLFNFDLFKSIDKH